MTWGSIWRVLIVLGALRVSRRPLLRFWRSAEHPLNLAVARILVMATSAALAWNIWPVNQRMVGLPHELILPLVPPSLPAAVLLPHPQLVAWLSLPFVLCCLLGCLGLATRVTVPAAALMGCYLLGIPGVFSKLVHYHHVVWFMLFLACSPCHHALSLDAWWRARRGRPFPNTRHRCYTPALRLMQIHIAIIYFFPGLWKATLHGIPQWCSSDNMRNILYWHWRYEWHMKTGWTPLWRLDHQPWLLNMGAVAAVLFELGLPFLILWRRSRPLALALAVGFHLFNHFLLKLGFWHLIVCDLCLIDWRRLQLSMGWGRANPRTQPPASGRSILVVGGALLLLNGYCGMRNVLDSWPWTIYPTLSALRPANNQELEVQVQRLDGSWQEVPLAPMEEFFGWARFHRTEIVLWREPWRLPAFWTVLRPYCPESIRRVRFYARRASGIPEEWDQPPLEHRLLKELVVTPGP